MITNECKAISKMDNSRLSGKKVLVTEAGQLLANGDKARQCIGWSLQVDLKEGLQRMIDRFRVTAACRLQRLIYGVVELK